MGLYTLTGTKDGGLGAFQRAIDDFNAYQHSGNFQQVLFMQYDRELIIKVDKIKKEYFDAFSILLNSQDTEKHPEAIKVFEKNQTKVTEVQELISKRLEEL